VVNHKLRLRASVQAGLTAMPAGAQRLKRPPLCRFGNDEAGYRLGRPASEKRQATKSQEVGHRRFSILSEMISEARNPAP